LVYSLQAFSFGSALFKFIDWFIQLIFTDSSIHPSFHVEDHIHLRNKSMNVNSQRIIFLNEKANSDDPNQPICSVSTFLMKSPVNVSYISLVLSLRF